MQLPFFYEEDLFNDHHLTLSEETSKHCIQVLRMKEGNLLQLTDGRGNLVTAQITTADKKHCIVIIEEKKFFEQASQKNSIAISLLKNSNRFEWFLEKATEIGITEIIPLLCARTERQHFRFERMNNIVLSAMLQSQQVWLPFLYKPQTFEKVVTSSNYQQKLIAHCENTDNKKRITSVAASNEIQLLIGPEGDFTAHEIELALKNNFMPVSLGKTRLRSETAGVVAAALLMNGRHENS